MFLASQLGNYPQIVDSGDDFRGRQLHFYAHPGVLADAHDFPGAAAAASAIGFINMIGNIGGFVGPVIVGNSAAMDGLSMATSLRNISPWSLIGAVILVAMDLFRRWRMRRTRA